MRVEPFTVNSYVHALKRGARGMPITNENSDRERFLRSLFYLNDDYFNEYWSRLRVSPTNLLQKVSRTNGVDIFPRPPEWPDRKPLVKILCYCLMPNHFHLLLKEVHEGGIAKFMQKLGQSMTNHFNEKYEQKGSIFQGGYKGKTVEDDSYLRYLAAYIMVKNPFELYPGGFEKAVKIFDDAYEWAINYPFCSLADYTGSGEHFQILDNDILGEIFRNPKDFRNFARDCIQGMKFGKVFLE